MGFPQFRSQHLQAQLEIVHVEDAGFRFSQVFLPDATAGDEACFVDPPSASGVLSSDKPPLAAPCLAGDGQRHEDRLEISGDNYTITNQYVLCSGATQNQTTRLIITRDGARGRVSYAQDILNSDGSFTWHADASLDLEAFLPGLEDLRIPLLDDVAPWGGGDGIRLPPP